MKYKICKVPLPNLGCRVYIIVAKDFQLATEKVFKSETPRKIKTNARALACHRENYSYVFFKPDADAGEMAHEMWHVIRHIFEYIGAELENEIVAYHLEYLVSESMYVLKKWARKIK